MPVNFLIKHRSGGQFFHPSGGNSNPGNETAIVLHGDIHKNMFWTFEKVQDHWGYIKHVSSGKIIQPRGGDLNPCNDTKLVLHSDRHHGALFAFDQANGHVIHIGGKYAHPYGGSPNPGNDTQVVLHQHIHDAMRFQFVAMDDPNKEIDEETIQGIHDSQPGQHITSLGDKVAPRTYCSQRKSSKKWKRTKPFEVLKRKVGKDNYEDSCSEESVAKSGIGRRLTRKIEMGWIHNGKKVRKIQGGGTRKTNVHRLAVKRDLIEEGKNLFFPNGISTKGLIANFNIDILDFKETSLPDSTTVAGCYNEFKTGIVSFYLHTWFKSEASGLSTRSNIIEDTSSQNFIENVTRPEVSDNDNLLGEVNDNMSEKVTFNMEYFPDTDLLHFGEMDTLGSGMASSQSDQAQILRMPVNFLIKHRSSGQFFHPSGGSSNPGNETAVVLHGDIHKNMFWTIEKVQDHWGYIKHVSSGKVIQPRGGNLNPGNDTKLVLRSDRHHGALFALDQANGHVIHICGKYAHPYGGSPNPGNDTQVVLHQHVHDAMRFQFVATDDPNKEVVVYGSPTLVGKWKIINMVRNRLA